MAVTALRALNRENPDVLRSLMGMIAIDPGNMRKDLKNNNVAILKFTCETHQKI